MKHRSLKKSTKKIKIPWFTFHCYWLDTVKREQALLLSWIEGKVEKAQRFHARLQNETGIELPEKVKAGWVLIDYQELHKTFHFFSVRKLKDMIKTLVQQKHLDYKEKQVVVVLEPYFDDGMGGIPALEEKVTKKWVRVSNHAFIKTVQKEKHRIDKIIHKMNRIDQFDVWGKNQIVKEYYAGRGKPHGFPIEYKEIKEHEDADSLILFSWVKRLNDIKHSWYKGTVKQIEKELKMKRKRQWIVIKSLITKGKIPPLQAGSRRELVSSSVKKMLKAKKYTVCHDD